MKTFNTLADLSAHVGTTVAVSEWQTISQAQINQFAEATGDHQWIHVDPQRAAQGPFGTPIAHGFLTLSLIPRFLESSMQVLNVRMGVNYGLNKVRFISPVPVNSRLRAHLKLLEVLPVDNGGLQQAWEVTVELEGAVKPACVAEALVRQYP
nr:MaoC family dehydratase [uncultured Rhodoferax sp.]